MKLLKLYHIGTVKIGWERLVGHVKTVTIRHLFVRIIRSSVDQAFATVVLLHRQHPFVPCRVKFRLRHTHPHVMGGDGDFGVMHHVGRQVHRCRMPLMTVMVWLVRGVG